MSKLSYAGRKRLPASAFALSGRRFPIEDKAHARNALARVAQGLKRGTITSAQAATVRRKVKAKYPGIK